MILFVGKKRVSVVILTKNAGPDFRETLGRVFAQKVAAAMEVLVLDSGSSDDTLEIAWEAGARTFEIEPGEFDHGHARNLGAIHTSGSHIAYLTQDAVPDDECWLQSLVDAVDESPVIAGAYSRVLPRDASGPLARYGVLRDINARTDSIRQGPFTLEEFDALDPYEKRLACNFNDVSSCIRREAWEKIPFQKTSWGEDLLWGRSALEAGYALRFEPRSVVRHSHDYTLPSLFRRTRIDGKMNRTILGRRGISGWGEVLRLTGRLVGDDLQRLRRESLPTTAKIRAALKSPVYHFTELLGHYLGGKTAYDAYRLVPVEKKRLRILMVLHGFPPYSVAGTEVYTLNLIRELKKRHDISVFYRVEDPERENYSLHTTTFEDVPAYEVVNNLKYQGIEQTVVNHRIEEKFRWVLEHVRPDVVHFQHCIHLSVSLISIARANGLATILTLHDYWFVCPMVQMIRPNRVVCSTRKPGLVCVGCSSRSTLAVRVGKTAFALFPPLVSLGVSLYGRTSRILPFLRRRLLLDAVALKDRLGVVRSGVEQASLLVSPSNFLKNRYVRYGFDRERILYSRNGLAENGLSEVERRPSSKIRLGYTGSLLWYKGLEVLIAAVNQLDPSEVELRIYGDIEKNPQAREYHARLASQVRSTAISFLGAYKNEDVASVFSNIDVLVVPSIWYENSPLTIQEAHAARTPVIASNLGAMKELVRDGVNGLLFEAGNPDDLARKIERIIRDPDLIRSFRNRIPPVKTISMNAAEMEVLYKQAMMRVDPGFRNGPKRSLPIQEICGKNFHRSRGSVRLQGEEFALLGPDGDRGSSTTYELVNPNGVSRFDLEVHTELLEGEIHVYLGGTVFLNDELLGGIPLHVYQPGATRTRPHRFPCSLRPGKNTLRISNSLPERHRGSACHLRIKRILLYEADGPGRECKR